MYPDPDCTPSPGVVNAPEVNAQNPWLGLLPYKENHHDFFFGRDREVDDIYGRIRDNNLTILYGQSGWGKSSLLAAGVMPKLREAGYAAVIVRLGYVQKPDRITLLGQSRAALVSGLDISGTLDIYSSLWQIFHHRDTPISPVPVIIFDQFEEIFTLGAHSDFEAEVTDWLEQMADLLQNRPPRHLAEHFAKDPELAAQYHFGHAAVRVVFTLREDYLANLERWKAQLPLLMQNRMAITLLTGPQARQAVLGPAQLGDHSLVTREVAECIVRRVVGKDVPVDTPLAEIKAVPPLLSLLCEQLNAARLAANSAQVTLEMVNEQSDDILQRFYENSFLSFPEEQRSIIRNFLENALLTKTEPAYRNTILGVEASRQLREAGIPDPATIIDTLSHRRLITAETRDNVQRLEITHDVLVPLVVRSRKEQQERDAKAQAESALEEERTKTRKRRFKAIQFFVLGLILVLLSAGLLAMAIVSKRNAIKSEKEQKELNESLKTLEQHLISNITNKFDTAEASLDQSKSKGMMPDLPPSLATEKLNENAGGGGTNLSASIQEIEEIQKENPKVLESLGFKIGNNPKILISLGFSSVAHREGIVDSIRILAARKEFNDIYLLSLLQIIEGAHLADEGEIEESIKFLEAAISSCKAAGEIAKEDKNRRESDLQSTRFKRRLSDIYYSLMTVENLSIASELLKQCINEAIAFDEKWKDDSPNRLHDYKTRLAKVFVAQSKYDPSKATESRQFLVEGAAHIRAYYAQNDKAQSYENNQKLAGLLWDIAEVARLQLQDHQLAVDLHTEVLDLRKNIKDGTEITSEIRAAIINQYWFLSAAWLGLDKNSPVFATVAEEGANASRWVVENSEDETIRAEYQTNIGVFEYFRLKAKLDAGDFSGIDPILRATLDNFDKALKIRIERPIKTDGLEWLLGQINMVIPDLYTHWNKINFSPEAADSLNRVMAGWRTLTIMELEKVPMNSSLALNAAVSHDWSSVLDQKRSDGASMIKHARIAQLLFLDFAEKFKDKKTDGKAWGLAGASSATRRIAEVLGGNPAGFQPKLLDGEDRLAFHELSVRQAESAIAEALSHDAMEEVAWMGGKLNDAIYSQILAFKALSYPAKDIAAAELRRTEAYKRIAKKYEEFFTKDPNGTTAYDWAFSGTSVLNTIWGNQSADIDGAETFSRQMLTQLQTQFSKNSKDPKFLMGISECQQCLVATIGYKVEKDTDEGIRMDRLIDSMKLLNEAREHNENALAIMAGKRADLESSAKSELIWILERLIYISKIFKLQEKQIPVWENRIIEIRK